MFSSHFSIFTILAVPPLLQNTLNTLLLILYEQSFSSSIAQSLIVPFANDSIALQSFNFVGLKSKYNIMTWSTRSANSPPDDIAVCESNRMSLPARRKRCFEQNRYERKLSMVLRSSFWNTFLEADTLPDELVSSEDGILASTFSSPPSFPGKISFCLVSLLSPSFLFLVSAAISVFSRRAHVTVHLHIQTTRETFSTKVLNKLCFIISWWERL
mmetsp:Transcript_37601/g.72852  ORF Transcript_37601/g.72852 Transcript_37601/m.72852 type:complete len:214 (-) Transcript_37601:2676-3317(-)